MSARKKTEVIALLERRDLDGVARWASRTAGALRILFLATFHADELVQWRAVEAIGTAAKVIFDADPEKVRDAIRRWLWLMNDESGGLGWRAPEAIGETLFNIPELIGEYGQMLCHFTKEEPFQRGAHLALARIAALKPELVEANVDLMIAALKDPDPAIRAHAITALSATDTDQARDAIEALAPDQAEYTRYDFDQGLVVTEPVGALVRRISTLRPR